MKILRLGLDAFGPFTDVTLDLAEGRQGLHLIYGPNEAGKSSALRALHDFFYGIPVRTPDDFIHPYKKMRLSARLQHGDGTVLDLVRFKRIKDALCEADGVTPADPARLERFLGGVDESMFSTLFGIDHATLVEGGKEIVEGGGHFGEVLFSASSGIAGLRGVQEQLQEDCEALFKPTGRNPRISKAITDLRAAQAQIKDLQLPSERWARHEHALREAEAEKAGLDELLRQKGRESSRLKRIRSALPMLAERKQLAEALDGCRDVILLPADFPDRRRDAQARLAGAMQEAERARLAIREHEARLERIQIPEALLAEDREIEALHERRGEFRKAQSDRPRLVFFLQDNEHSARDILQELGRPRDLASADAIRLRADEPVLIQQLGLQSQKLATQRDETRDAIARHAGGLQQVERDLDALGTTPDLEPLRAVLKESGRLGDLEGRLAEVRVQLDPMEKGAAAALRQLPGAPGTLGELEAQAVPLPETVARFAADFQAAEGRLRELELAQSQEESAIAALEAEIRALTLQRDVPTEDDLERARRRRDEGWRLVRRAWLDGLEDAAAPEFIDELAPGRTLADAFEAAVARGDAVADRLRREANDVARKSGWVAQLHRHREQLARIGQDLGAARASLERHRSDWGRVVEPLGLASPPAELAAWLAKREKLVDQLGQLRIRRAEVDRLRRQIAERRDRLSSCLVPLNAPGAGEEEGLAALIDRAETLVARHGDAARRRDRLDAERTKVRRDLDAAEARLRTLDADRDAWRVRWGECMARIGLDPQATPEQAGVFLAAIQKLFQHLDKAKDFRVRIKGIDRDSEQFASDLAEIVRRAAPDLAGRPPADAAEEVVARLHAARADRQMQEAIRTQIESETAALAAAERAIASARLLLDALCRDAGQASPDDLPAAEQASAHRSRLEADLARCEQGIRGLSAGASVEAFAAEVDRLDPDGIDQAIAALDDETARLLDRLAAVNQTIGAEQKELALMDGSSKAAEANELLCHSLAQLQSDVPRYAALKIAAAVLQQGIERYRQRNEGPVLARASRLFAALTAGSFESLRIDYDDRGEALLVGVRPGGETGLNVECMSDGSCDQLYLALRIASLENWLTAHEPIPLIVDDILLHFDDARATAALKVLADLSAKTQVIFFTHHRHLVDLARSSLPPETLYSHELPGRFATGPDKPPGNGLHGPGGASASHQGRLPLER